MPSERILAWTAVATTFVWVAIAIPTVSPPHLPSGRTLLVAAFVCFVFAIPPLGLRINLTALGLALLTLALFLGG